MSQQDLYGEDPKTTLIRLLSHSMKVTKDDGEKATVRITEGDFNGKVFDECEAQVTVNLAGPSAARTMNLGGTLKKYSDRYRLTGYAINKDGVTAKKMRWKLRKELERIIEFNRKAPGGDLTRVSVVSISEGREETTPKSYSVIVTVETLRYEFS